MRELRPVRLVSAGFVLGFSVAGLLVTVTSTVAVAFVRPESLWLSLIAVICSLVSLGFALAHLATIRLEVPEQPIHLLLRDTSGRSRWVVLHQQ